MTTTDTVKLDRATLEAAARLADDRAKRAEAHPMFPAFGLEQERDVARSIAAAIRSLAS